MSYRWLISTMNQFYRVYLNNQIVSEISAATIEEASEIAAKAYPGQTTRVEII